MSPNQVRLFLPETICHIFLECNKIQHFGQNLRDYIFTETNKDIDIYKKSAPFGQQFNDCLGEKNRHFVEC